jgi:two-component system, chemotaxis family, response regulator Rcp1
MKTRNDGRPAEVLLAEDAPGDVRLTLEAFRDAGQTIHVHLVGGGVEALAFLGRQGAHARIPRPDLSLLDLNLPGMDGRQLPAHITLSQPQPESR